MKPHWYHTTVFECPVCGHEDVMRERRHSERPQEAKDRYEFRIAYDNCMEYSMGYCV